MSAAPTVLEALRAGRDFFAESEWCRDGSFGRGADGSLARDAGSVCSVCMLGALYYGNGAVTRPPSAPGSALVFRHPDVSERVLAARERLREALPDDERFTTKFSDEVAETKEDCLAVYDRAIALEEERS